MTRRSGASFASVQRVATVVAQRLSLTVRLAAGRGRRPGAAAALAIRAVAQLIASEQALLDLTNADRVANGLPALEFDPDTLADRPPARGQPARTADPDPLRRQRQPGLRRSCWPTRGSTTAWRAKTWPARPYDDAGVTQRVEDALMQSPKHRKNILEPTFNRVSIGAATDASGQITFAEVYRN